MTIKLSDHFSYAKLIRFVLPSVGMMIFTSIYSVVDGLFVSNFVGKTPFAAVNLIMPFVMIFGAVGFMLGTGGCALVSKTLGEGDSQRANRYFSMIVLMTLLTGLLLSLVGILFMRPIARALGADGALIGDCVLYGRILLGFNAMFMLQQLFQTFFVAAQKPKLGFYYTVAAGVANMLLDALFIAGFGWGVAGAAVATGLSQCIGGLLPLFYFGRRNDGLLRLRPTRLEMKPILSACGNGASEMLSNISGSIVGMAYNLQLMKYAGENGVAAYGVLMYVNFIFIAIFIGYTIGSAPIISYHYGADNRAELKSMLRKSLTLTAAVGVAMTLLAEWLATPIARVFVGYDAALMRLTRHAFLIGALPFLLTGINIFASAFFTALNNGAVSAVLSFARTLVLQLLCVLLLPRIFGLDGIWWAVVVEEVCALVISLGFLIGMRRKYGY